MTQKAEIIIAAQEAGYFKTKKQETRDTLLAEIQENFFDPEEVKRVLEAETQRRSDVYARRQKAKVAKDLAQAEKPLTGETASIKREVLPAQGVYVFTTCQNNTDVHMPFLRALETYCSARNARLFIGRTAYNKQGFCQPETVGDDLYYAPILSQYFVDREIQIGNVVWHGNANIIPTAKNPCAGYEHATDYFIDQILPAVKISLLTVPATDGYPKTLHSTGAITLPNYVQRKAGQTAQREHNIGALVLEFDANGRHWIRQLEMMPGCEYFHDLGNVYNSLGKVMQGVQPVALQPGDIHAEKSDAEQLDILNDMCQALSPKNIIVHDLLDFTSRNHHNIKDPFFRAKHDAHGSSVADDLRSAAEFIAGMAVYGNVHIVESNHDLALDKWLNTVDWRDDTVNAETYLRCALYKLERLKNGEPVNLLQFAFDNIARFPAPVFTNFMRQQDSLMIGGVEMSQHGHNGPNGAKGSPQGFRKLGRAMNTGHTHTPSICGPVYTAGVLGSLDMGYNVGPSSWRHAHILTYDNGQRQMIDTTNGNYCA